MPGRTLSRGDVHLFLAGVFLATYVLVRFTDPSDYGMTLHPRLDKVWTTWRMLISAGWLLLALLFVTIRKVDAHVTSASYAAAATTGLGLLALAVMYPQSSSALAVAGSLAVYAMTSGALCLKVQRPIPAALLGGLVFILQLLVDGTVHFLTGAFRIH
jgi:hypothetical protein